MKTKLFYFSGTGNTLQLARLLAAELENTEIINIVSCKEKITIEEKTRIGILYPVYAFGLPRAVQDFVKTKLDVNSKCYIFAFTNYAGAGGAAANSLLNYLLKEKGLKLNASFGVKMPSNYIPFGGSKSPEKIDKIISAAKKQTTKIAGTIRKAPEKYRYKMSLMPGFASRYMNRQFMKSTPKEAKRFYYTEECTSCGLCESICPTDNIQIQSGHPVWGDNCEQCLACLQWCPVQAIKMRGVPEHRKQYHNPEVKAEDLLKDMNK